MGVMSGSSGISSLAAMRGRRKGGAPAPQTVTPTGISAHADAFLSHLAARSCAQSSIEGHRWALRQFSAWADSQCANGPAAFIRADLEACQLSLHRYRSLRGGRPLVTIAQGQSGQSRCRAFIWTKGLIDRAGTFPGRKGESAAPVRLATGRAKAVSCWGYQVSGNGVRVEWHCFKRKIGEQEGKESRPSRRQRNPGTRPPTHEASAKSCRLEGRLSAKDVASLRTTEFPGSYKMLGTSLKTVPFGSGCKS